MKQIFRQRKGSTIVGVLAALVFIGVVTTFMVGNTRSQSATSIGYSKVLAASVSANSGTIATETYLNTPSTASTAVDLLESAAANNTPMLINKQPITSVSNLDDQKISTQILDFNHQTFFSRLEINGWKENTSKRAIAIYKLGGIAVVNPDYGAKNALYSEGGLDWNQALTFEENANVTVNGTVKLQNGTSTFGGLTWFDDSIHLNNSSTIFEENTYIKKGLNPQASTTFEEDVGIETSIDLGGHNVTVEGDAYLNGKFSGNKNNHVVMDASGNGVFNYTNQFDETEKNRITGPGSNKKNRSNQMDLPDSLGMTKQTEDELDVSKIPSIVNPIVPSTNTVMTASWLHDKIKNATADQKWNEHLVVKISNSNVKLRENYKTTFHGKVIFIVESELKFGGNGYDSHDTSSTLIFVKSSGKVSNMGFNGKFRGLVYIENGSSGNTFNLTNTTEINGAIHNMSNTEIIAANGSSSGTIFSLDHDALANFSRLKKSYTETDPELILTGTSIDPSAAGFYFF